MVNLILCGFLGLVKYSTSRITFAPSKHITTLYSAWEFVKGKFHISWEISHLQTFIWNRDRFWVPTGNTHEVADVISGHQYPALLANRTLSRARHREPMLQRTLGASSPQRISMNQSQHDDLHFPLALLGAAVLTNETWREGREREKASGILKTKTHEEKINMCFPPLSLA